MNILENILLPLTKNPPVGQGLKASAVVVPIIKINGQDNILLIRKTLDGTSHGGQVAFPGGKASSSDTDLLSTALRETMEEIGLNPDNLKPLGRLSPISTITGFHIESFVASVIHGTPYCASPNEVARIFYLPLSILSEDIPFKTFSLYHNEEKLNTKGFYFDKEFIWGATARIIDDLSKRIRKSGCLIDL